MLGMVAGPHALLWGAAASPALPFLSPGEFLLSGLLLLCSSVRSTEGAPRIDCSEHRRPLPAHIHVGGLPGPIYLCPLGLSETTSVCEHLERVVPQKPFRAPQQPLVSGGPVIRVPSIYLSQSFPKCSSEDWENLYVYK